MRWIIFILIYLVLDLYAYQAFRTLTRHTWIFWVFFVLSLGVLAFLMYQFNAPESGRLSINRNYAIGLFLVLFVPKLFLFILLLGEDVIRVMAGLVHKLQGPTEPYSLPSRRKFISQIALGVAAIPFTSLLYGMYRGRYDYQVVKHVLHFPDLPEAFDVYRITQISDIHSGSFDNEEKIRYGIDLINSQESDVILFTGDLVNNTADEMKDWKDLFSQLSARDGVFSILGNHDYGDYASWSSPQAKEANLDSLKTTHAEMGWRLLLNEHVYLTQQDSNIALVGVENWGRGFKQAGDLEQAASGIPSGTFKVLLSHDPSHWEEQVRENARNFQLTLSGHTHGMQFGIEIPGWFRWSPAQYRYKHWAGIYSENGRFLNVNRGFGFLAYPGRVGIWPEITVIELRRGDSPA